MPRVLRSWSFWLLAAGFFVALLGARPAGAQPPVPHPVAGREQCTACHQTGVGGAPRFPADHAGRTDAICTQCHAVSAAPAQVAPERPPAVRHSLIGREHCLACHAKGVGGAPIPPPGHQGRDNSTCQGCHSPAPEALATPSAQAGPTPVPQLRPTPVGHPAGGESDSCLDCHQTLGGHQTEIAEQWQASVHAKYGVRCADCHGGDPRTSDVNLSMSPAAGYIGAPDKTIVPELCGSCHSDVERMRQYDVPTDQLAKYEESVHGRLLREKGDRNVAVCSDCHGAHTTQDTSDPSANVYVTNVPALCARCHADAQLMAPYGIPTDQFDLYKTSVHGEALLQHQDPRAPSCATCHGTHGAAPPGVAEVANICGSCHSATQDHYLQSRHAKVGDAAPKCITCHGRHDVTRPDEAMFSGPQDRHCGSCHQPGSPIAADVMTIQNSLVDAALASQRAEESIRRAAGRGMIVTLEESTLAKARTSLITARAAQHTGQVEVVKKLTDQAQVDGKAAEDSAEKKLAESVFRRQAMIVVVVGIALTVGALSNVKRELDKRLGKE